VGSAATLFTLFAVYELVSLLDDLVEHNLPFLLALTYLKFRTPWIVSQFFRSRVLSRPF